jgi:hypothetical protein
MCDGVMICSTRRGLTSFAAIAAAIVARREVLVVETIDMMQLSSFFVQPTPPLAA